MFLFFSPVWHYAQTQTFCNCSERCNVADTMSIWQPTDHFCCPFLPGVTHSKQARAWLCKWGLPQSLWLLQSVNMEVKTQQVPYSTQPVCRGRTNSCGFFAGNSMNESTVSVRYSKRMLLSRQITFSVGELWMSWEFCSYMVYCVWICTDLYFVEK